MCFCPGGTSLTFRLIICGMLNCKLKGTHLLNGVNEAIRRLTASSYEEADEILQNFRDNDVSISEIYSWLRLQLKERFLVDKSPSYLCNVKILERAELLTTACGKKPLYIFLRRHPFDTFGSLVKNDFHKLLRQLDVNRRRLQRKYHGGSDWIYTYVRTPENPCKTPMEIAEGTFYNCIGNTLEFLSSIPSERQLQICYETLVTDPDTELNKICDLLEIPFEDSMLSPYTKTVSLIRTRETVKDPNFELHDTIKNSLMLQWEKDREKWVNHVYSASTPVLSRRLGYSLPPITSKSYLAPAQEVFFKTFGQDTGSFLVMDFRLRLTEGVLDRNRLQQAMDRVIRRNPALRLYFRREGSNWIQYCPPSIPEDPIEYLEEHSAVGENGQSALFLKLKELEAEIKLHELPLFRVLIGKENGGRSYRVAYLFHHLISDGISLVNFHQQLWASYANPDQRNIGTSRNFQDYTVDAYRLKRDTDLVNLGKMLESTITPMAPAALFSGGKASANRYDDQIEYHESIQLPSNIKERYRLYEAAAALYLSYSTWANDKQPVIAHRLSRRHLNGRNYRDAIGWFAGDVPIRIQLPGVALAVMKEIKGNLMNLSMGGLEYDWLYVNDLLPPLHSFCSLRFNYFPVPAIRQAEGIMVSDMDVTLHQAPGSIREYAIDFIVRDSRREMKVIIRYSRELFTEDSIAELLAEWKVKFSEITKC